MLATRSTEVPDQAPPSTYRRPSISTGVKPAGMAMLDPRRVEIPRASVPTRLAVGMAIVIIGRGIDLSAVAIMAMSAARAATASPPTRG